MATLFDDQVRAALASGPQTLPQIATATGLGFALVLMVVQEMRRDGAVRETKAPWRIGGMWEYELASAAPWVEPTAATEAVAQGGR